MIVHAQQRFLAAGRENNFLYLTAFIRKEGMHRF